MAVFSSLIKKKQINYNPQIILRTIATSDTIIPHS